ncbi:E3 ubiquitin/ISG15 ligase TRIM25-like [Engraulis encrasicolus]|uniref:E3 ubiquitin/ISG15 ligase TRIM25-like n=1 Tax=Engraulis encrasicolus TaxID=184585 RepID=UPI002FD68EF3
MFTEMIHSFERRCSEVTELIRAQEKDEVNWTEGLLKRLEQEIAELKRTDAEMKQLSLTQDPIHFLKNIVSINGRPYSTISTNVTFSQNFSLEPLKKSVTALKMQLEEKLESVFKQEIVKISAAAVKNIQIIESIQREFPTHTQSHMLSYTCDFTVDPNTAFRELHLSEESRRVDFRYKDPQSYPDHPNRFDVHPQGKPADAILCSALTRRGKMRRCRTGPTSDTDEVSFTCPVCLDLLRDPVTIPCGHNFCMRCIKGCWDDPDDLKKKYSCPLCMRTFNSRPVLHKNRLMAEMVKKFEKTSPQAVTTADCYAGPEDVECDFCTRRKLKAVKSCLECLKSYCTIHLKDHNELIGRNHNMIVATGQLQEMVCPRHKKVFEIFCRTDQSCICYLCTMDDHKGHDTITATAEWSHKKEGLGQSQRRCHQIIQLKEKELQELRKAVETLKSDAQTAVKESERMLTEMIHSIERRCSEVTELIRAQEKAEVSRAEGLLKQLEQEIAELKRTDAEIRQLSQTQDPIHFLKKLVSIDGDSCSDETRRTFSQSHFFEPLKESVSALKMQLVEKIESVFKQEIVKISAAGQFPETAGEKQGGHTLQSGRPQGRNRVGTLYKVTGHRILILNLQSEEQMMMEMGMWMKIVCVSVFVCACACVVSLCLMISTAEPEPVTREDFLKYSYHFTLDLNTASTDLHLSEGNRRVEYRPGAPQSYPDHPDRFDCRNQVLCREGVSARCYWEVEWSGVNVEIAVSYKSISRKGVGSECSFGRNGQSWSLDLRSSNSFFYHNYKKTELPLVASSRIGVYVDHRAGTLAFYSIRGDTMTLLHRVHTTFTHTLYPGFGLHNYGTSVKLL